MLCADGCPLDKLLTRLQHGYEPHHHYCDYHRTGPAHHRCHLEQVQMSVFHISVLRG